MEASGISYNFGNTELFMTAACNRADRRENSPAPPAQQDELVSGHHDEMPRMKRISHKPLSAHKSLLSPSWKKLMILGVGLLCQFGSVVAQPLMQGTLGEKDDGALKDKTEVMIEKPMVYDSLAGQTIAKNAIKVAKKLNTVGYCYRGVKAALLKSGTTLTGRCAYMGATQIAALDNFQEITVKREDLGSLQPGSVVVWSKSKNTPYGHISIALGDGREASDHIERQFTKRGHSTFRVFIPVTEAPEREKLPAPLAPRTAFLTLQWSQLDSLTLR